MHINLSETDQADIKASDNFKQFKQLTTYNKTHHKAYPWGDRIIFNIAHHYLGQETYSKDDVINILGRIGKNMTNNIDARYDLKNVVGISLKMLDYGLVNLPNNNPWYVDRLDQKRADYMIEYGFKTQIYNGVSYLTQDQLNKCLQQTLAQLIENSAKNPISSDSEIKQVQHNLLHSTIYQKVTYDNNGDQIVGYMLTAMYNQNKALAHHILSLSELPVDTLDNSILKITFEQGFKNPNQPNVNYTIDEEQQSNIKKSLANHFTFIDGNAGTGKTTYVSALINYLNQKDIPYLVGSENTESAYNLMATAQTSEHIWAFHDNMYKPKFINELQNSQYLIIDDISSVTEESLGIMLNNLPDHGHVIMLGTTNGMPAAYAIGLAPTLLSYIKAHSDTINYIKLTHNYRQETTNELTKQIHQISNQETPTELPTIESTATNHENNIIYASNIGHSKLIDYYTNLYHRYANDNDLNVNIITYTSADANTLNTEIQTQLMDDNEIDRKVSTRYVKPRNRKTFYVGDRVITTQPLISPIINNELEPITLPAGSIGIIDRLSIHPETKAKGIVVKFNYLRNTHRHIEIEYYENPIINNTHSIEQKEKYQMHINDNINYTFGDLQTLNLAYAQPLKNYEGDTLNYAFIYMPLLDLKRCKQQWLYEAITRAMYVFVASNDEINHNAMYNIVNRNAYQYTQSNLVCELEFQMAQTQVKPSNTIKENSNQLLEDESSTTNDSSDKIKHQIIIITKNQRINRIEPDEIPEASRIAKGARIINLGENDEVQSICESNGQPLIAISNEGRIYKCNDEPIVNNNAESTIDLNSLHSYIDYPTTEQIIKLLPTPTKSISAWLTTNGQLTKISTNEALSTIKNHHKVITLKDNDQLLDVLFGDENDQLLIGTKNNRIAHHEINKYPLRHVLSVGVKSIDLQTGDAIIGGVLTDQSDILTIDTKGRGNLSALTDYPVHRRGDKGVLTYASTSNATLNNIMVLIERDHLRLITHNGQSKSIATNDLSTNHRGATGKLIFKLATNDSVKMNF